ncbi:hypothetical protein O6H91_11G030400 [Diphasiastrum complanatum]|uniref:Uncharacterized protein n=1 Tax=Diphasiastrum complanatum TaxID=34168 RepID=A0ACC2C8L3_DIPCM|nr:hypothetical protein O6H91_11G030400 [Diphasiastrum complanatum]
MQPPQPRRRRKSRIQNGYKEIRKYQKSTIFLIPRVPFVRTIKEIMDEFSLGLRITGEATSAIQETTEMYLTNLFENSFLCAVHCKRVIILPKDMLLAKWLRRERN